MRYALAIAPRHDTLVTHHLHAVLDLHHLAPHHAVIAVLLSFHLHAVRAALARLVSAAAAVFRRKRPRVSVITPTWQRAELLKARCMPSVAAQTYRDLEHVIVCDGPDPALAGCRGVTFLPAHIPEPNRGLSARSHGITQASGEVIAYLDDDNAWRRRHLELLVDALLQTGADFAYSRARCHAPPLSWTIGRQPPKHGPPSWTIGRQPPAFGQIDTSLLVHWRHALDAADWVPSQFPADWDLVCRWQLAGLKWAFVPQVTMDYYVRPAS